MLREGEPRRPATSFVMSSEGFAKSLRSTTLLRSVTADLEANRHANADRDVNAHRDVGADRHECSRRADLDACA